MRRLLTAVIGVVPVLMLLAQPHAIAGASSRNPLPEPAAAKICQMSPKNCTPWVDLDVSPFDGQTLSNFLWKYNQTWTYGFTQNGANYTVGQVQLVGNLNLNGRQPQWAQSIATFSGPAVNGNNEWNCVDQATWDQSCSGGWQTRWRGSFSTATWPSSANYYLSNNDWYWFNYQWFWQAQGWPYTWNTSELTTNHLLCQNRVSPCQFQ